MADVKPTILSWIIVTLMAITGIVFLKYAASLGWLPAGVSAIITAV